MKQSLFPLAIAGILVFVISGCGARAPYTSIHQAAKDGKLDLINQHIKAGTDVNTKDSTGWTPLHLATMGGHVDVVAALLDEGADPNAPGQMGKTPLIVAQEKRQDAVIQMLQPAGQPATGGRPLVDGGLGVSGVLDAF